MKKCCILILMVISVANQLTAQNLQTLKGYVLSEKGQQPIAYAKVYNATIQEGILSNTAGFYEIQYASGADSITFSFTGFEKRTVAANELKTTDTVYLSQISTLLGTVDVFADNSFLYDLIASCSKEKIVRINEAKTYFSLQTHIENIQVELVECFYNGQFSTYDVKSLELKKGRIALNATGNRLTTSLDLSKAFYLHELFDENEFFPGNPFELNKRKLKKTYHLYLISKFHLNESNIMYAINFKSKRADRTYFNGTVWMDSIHQQVHKIELVLDSTAIHPFRYIGSESELNQVNLHLTKTFESINEKMQVNSVFFDFEITHKKHGDSTQLVKRSTRSILYAFDYSTTFILPEFEFISDVGDYRKISVSPYDHFFWENFRDFRLSDQNAENAQFFKNADLTSEVLFDTKHVVRKELGIFESDYIAWSEDRVYFREEFGDSINRELPNSKGKIPASLYNLKAQIFMDINTYNDTFYVFTETVFDPFQSFYYLPWTLKSATFVNIYFDLVEIRRREMEVELLSTDHSRSALQRIYREHLNKIQQESLHFFREVDRGENRPGLEKWNAIVMEKLKIDNISIFMPY